MKGVLMLSRKHYRVIASIIKDNSVKTNELKVRIGNKLYIRNGDIIIDREGFINDITSYFNSDNNAFSWERFVNACDE